MREDTFLSIQVRKIEIFKIFIGLVISGTMKKLADTERDQAFDIVWVHSSAVMHSEK